MGVIGLVLVCLGCLITGVGIFSAANLFGLMSKDERYHGTTTDKGVHRTNLWVLLTGLGMLALGFGFIFLTSA